MTYVVDSKLSPSKGSFSASPTRKSDRSPSRGYSRRTRSKVRLPGWLEVPA